jgi:hypothetical protein
MGRFFPNVFLLSKATGRMMVSLIQPSLRSGTCNTKNATRTKVPGYFQAVPSSFVSPSHEKRSWPRTTADKPERTFCHLVKSDMSLLGVSG